MNYDIAKEWLNRGKNETEIVYRFICFYIAFNSLYDQEKQRWEYERVSSFIKKYMERNPFYNPSSLFEPVLLPSLPGQILTAPFLPALKLL